MPGIQLFPDKKFFLLQRVPTRSRFIQDIEHNGGQVVRLEQQADYVIADHLRKDAPAGSLSWKFIDEAVKIGEIPDETPFRLGAVSAAPASTSRNLGGLSQPVKSTRTPFTAADDLELWNHVRSYGRAGAVGGNEIYKELAIKNPRHTYQSWRDRYIKYLSLRPPVTADTNALPTPPLDPGSTTEAPQPLTSPAQAQRPASPQRPIQRRRPNTEHNIKQRKTSAYPHGFTEGHLELLIDEAKYIEEIPPESIEVAWATYADQNGGTAEQWQGFYQGYARPEWKRRLALKEEARKSCSRGRGFIDQLDGAAASRMGESSPVAPPSAEAVKQEASAPNKAKAQETANVNAAESPPSSGSKRLAEKSLKPELKRQRKKIEKELLSKQTVSALEVRAETYLESPPRPSTGAGVDTSRELERPQDPAPQEKPPVPDSQLTEENLAKLRMQARGAPSRRGQDLIPDQEDEEQIDFMDYLQNLMTPDMKNVVTSKAGEEAQPVVKPSQTVRATPVLQYRRRSPVREPLAKSSKPTKHEVIEISDTDPSKSSEEEEDDDDDRAFEDSRNPSADLGSSPMVGSATEGRLPEDRLPDDDSDDDMIQSSRQLNDEYRKAQQYTRSDVATNPIRTSGSRNAFAQRALDTKHFTSSPRLQSSPRMQHSDAIQSDKQDAGMRIQFDELPEPVGGWIDHFSSQSPDQSIPPAAVGHSDHGGTTPKPTVETQGYFDDSANNFVFDISDFDDESAVRSPPHPTGNATKRRSTYFIDDSRSVTPIESQGVDIVDFVESKTAEGYQEAHVWDALHACSMRTPRIDVVLKFLKSGKGLPSTISGVWSEKEDKDLASGDPAVQARLLKKHGSREINVRKAYLRECP